MTERERRKHEKTVQIDERKTESEDVKAASALETSWRDCGCGKLRHTCNTHVTHVVCCHVVVFVFFFPGTHVNGRRLMCRAHASL